MGEGKLTPLTTPTPLNRQSRNIAYVITSTISPHKPHLVKIAPGVTSPHIAKVTTQFFYFFLCTQKYFHGPRAQAVEPILTCDTSKDVYSRRSSHFLIWDPLISPKLTELESSNLICWQAFAGTMATYKNLTAGGRLGRSAVPTFYFGTPSISP